MKKQTILLLALISSSAFAQYKCVVDGKTSFQDLPCSSGSSTPLNVKYGSIQGAPEVKTQQSNNTVENLKKSTNSLEKARLIREKQYQIENIQNAKYGLQAELDKKLEALRIKKQSANNNLAGATWEQSISQEMTSLTESYKSKFSNLDSQLQMAQQQLTKLQE